MLKCFFQLLLTSSRWGHSQGHRMMFQFKIGWPGPDLWIFKNLLKNFDVVRFVVLLFIFSRIIIHTTGPFKIRDPIIWLVAIQLQHCEYLTPNRQTKFYIKTSNRLRIGWNILSNRFWHLNGKIDLGWLNLSFGAYKVHCKKLFL